MGHDISVHGHSNSQNEGPVRANSQRNSDFVLEKSIFNNVFEKDIRRVFIYKKAERLAKVVQRILPAFTDTPVLRSRLEATSVALIDASILPSDEGRRVLSRELLSLSSTLALASVGGYLSHMNADLISHEAQAMLQEVADYEEPRTYLDESPTLASIAKSVVQNESHGRRESAERSRSVARPHTKALHPEYIKDIGTPADGVLDRREAILSVIKNKGTASIKDISTVIRTVSEKTIQRELIALIALGEVAKSGERRWSTYSLV